MSASCGEEKHTARKRKVIPLLKGNEIKLWIYKKKELKENLIFSCWSLINISSDEAFWSPHPNLGTAGRTETFHLIFLSPLKTSIHQRGPTDERTRSRDRPISFSIINTQFLTKLSTSILPVSIFWHNYCNIFSRKPWSLVSPCLRISASLARSYHLLPIPRYDQPTSLRLWSTPQCTLLLPLNHLSELLVFLCVCLVP